MPRNEPLKGPDGNVNKYKSYRHAWGDIRKAIGTGHFAEAVAREESIISDRLLSYLCYMRVLKQEDSQNQAKKLNELIQRWKKSVPEPIQDRFFDDLQTATDDWRKKRNKVHGMVKSLPGQDHQDPLEFKKEEKQVALDGERLAKSIQNWYRRVKDQIKKNEKI